MRSAPIVRRCLFIRNESSGGGAIAVDEYSEPLILDCEVRDNSVLGLGGGVLASIASKPVFMDCDIHHNTAGDGGGFATENAIATLLDCSIHDNQADYGGGMALLNGFQLLAERTTVRDNTATENGGGLYAFQSPFELDGCELGTNHAGVLGGAGWLYESEGSINGSRMIGNSAGGAVGGMHLDGYSYLTIQSSEIEGNELALYIDGAPGRPLDARHNWWGDPTGPYHPTANPGGLGDAIGDHVDFVPWNTAAGVAFPHGAGAGRGVGDVPRLALASPTRAPFRIAIHLPGATHARLRVYDVQGRLVARLLDRDLGAGQHVVDWDAVATTDGRSLRGGIVFLRLELDARTLTRKVTLLD